MTVVSGLRVVTPSGVLRDGWVHTEGGAIVAVGSGRPGVGGGQDVDGAWLLPGFVDLHMHGGGGHDVAASRADMAAAIDFHRRCGTTRTVVSLITAPESALVEQLGWVADLAADGDGIVGAHLEGPFLARQRRGAHPEAHLQPPDVRAYGRMVDAARGCLRIVTVAPELPGALGLIEAIVASGAIAALGHSQADYQQAMAGFAVGASLTTHLFNAMEPLHHREPGLIGATLDAGHPFELICDGHHVHPALVRLMAHRPDALVLITDAMAAAGCGDGASSLGGQAVEVRGGRATLVDGAALAGSTLTMADAVRGTVGMGVPIELVSAAASAHPARVLGLSDRCGAIAAGFNADLVLLDEDLSVLGVMVRGEWIDGAPPRPSPAAGRPTGRAPTAPPLLRPSERR